MFQVLFYFEILIAYNVIPYKSIFKIISGNKVKATKCNRSQYYQPLIVNYVHISVVTMKKYLLLLSFCYCDHK
jgi:hypothetical protein